MEFLVYEEIIDVLEDGAKEFYISESYFDYTVKLLKERVLEAEFIPVQGGFRVTIF
jgi:hypothetical protein